MSKKDAKKKREELAREIHARHDDGRGMPIQGRDSGAFGKIAELNSCVPYSRKESISGDKEPDFFVKWRNGKGQNVSRPCERKTNGGRIPDLYHADASALIVYELRVNNSNTGGSWRVIEPMIFLWADFRELLEEAQALKKSSKGKRASADEPQIQATLKRWYDALLATDKGIPFDPMRQYSMDDFTR